MNKHDNIGTFCRKCRQVICTCKKQSYYEILEDGYSLNEKNMEYILELMTAYGERNEVDIMLHINENEYGYITDKLNNELFDFDSIDELIQKLL